MLIKTDDFYHCMLVKCYTYTVIQEKMARVGCGFKKSRIHWKYAGMRFGGGIYKAVQSS